MSQKKIGQELRHPLYFSSFFQSKNKKLKPKKKIKKKNQKMSSQRAAQNVPGWGGHTGYWIASGNKRGKNLPPTGMKCLEQVCLTKTEHDRSYPKVQLTMVRKQTPSYIDRSTQLNQTHLTQTSLPSRKIN